MNENKPHAPSARKLRDARRRGEVARSALLTQYAGIIGIIAGALSFKTIVFIGPLQLIQSLGELSFTFEELRSLVIPVGQSVVMAVAPLLVAGGLCALLVEWSQVGWGWSGNSISLDFSRLNPVVGLQRMWRGIRGAWEIALKLAVMLITAALVLRDLFKVVKSGEDLSVSAVFGRPILFMSGALLVVALFDRVRRRRDFMQRLRMSDQELRQEHKDEDGDPLTKALRRSMHESLSRQELVKRIRRSKVLVVRRSVAS